MVSTSIPLISSGAGTYLFGDDATQVQSHPNNSWIDFAINSSDHLGMFYCDFEFPEKPVKLSTFLEFLESQGEINVQLSNHTVTRIEEDGRASFTIEPDSNAVYKLNGYKARSPKPNAKCGLAWIDLETIKHSPNITLAQGFLCHSYCLLVLGYVCEHIDHMETFNDLAEVQEG